MTDRLAEIRARAEAATPGPWQTRFIYRMFKRVRESPGDLAFNTKSETDWADSDFIAEARADIPYLLDLLDAKDLFDAKEKELAEARGTPNATAMNALLVSEVRELHISLRAERERADALQESAYIAGLKAGYNLGIDENQNGLAAAIAVRDGYLKALAAARQEELNG